MNKYQKPEIAEIAIEELTVYRYHVALTDDVDDPGAVALERFRNGEPADAGPVEGEQHELSAHYVGQLPPPAAPWVESEGLDYDQWWENFKSQQNSETTSFDGAMFETYGDDLEAVRRHQPNHIWTLIQADDGDLWIVSGYHLVNRLGYFVTRQPHEGKGAAEVRVE
jgi:hypothetical protein